MFEWLKRDSTGRWSIYVVQHGHQILALADSNHDGVAPTLDALARLFEKFGDPEGPYRICFVFNPTRHVIWIEANSFVGGKPDPALVNELRKTDPRFSRRAGRAALNLQFVDPATGREIERSVLLARLWPASV